MASYIIGICGGSASGKTYLLNQLIDHLPPDKVTLISQDNYYKNKEEQQKTEDGLINFDHPESVNLARLEVDILRLLEGKEVTIQEYTFNNPNRKARTICYRPTEILILEGLFIFHRPSLNKLIDLKVFIDADEHVKLARRLRRDLTERGYSFEDTLRDYEKFVAPMFYQYIAPQKSISDLVIPNNRHMNNAIGVLTDHLKARLSTN
jgi:uridine kinase